MRQIDQKLQLLLQTWAEPCKHLLFLYKQSRDTWALSCGIYGNHTERSKQVFFLTLTCTRHHVLILRWDSEHVTVRCRYKHQCSYWLQFTSIFVYISSLRRRVSSAAAHCWQFLSGWWMTQIKGVKSERAASARALQRASARSWHKSRHCEWNRCRCWSKCPAGCSRAQSHPHWSPQ